MFGVSFFELVVVLLVVLVFIGPDKLPEAASKLGRMMAFLKRNSDSLRREFYNAIYTPSQEIQQKINLAARELLPFDPNDPVNMNCEQRARLEAKKREEEEAQAAASSAPPKEPDEPKL